MWQPQPDVRENSSIWIVLIELMKTLCLALILSGLALIVAGGIPPNGFGQLRTHLEEYKNAKYEKRTPTLNQKGAYYSHLLHRAGGFLIITGIIFGLLVFLM